MSALGRRRLLVVSGRELVREKVG